MFNRLYLFFYFLLMAPAAFAEGDFVTNTNSMSLAEIETRFHELQKQEETSVECHKLVPLAALNNDPRGLALAEEIHQFCISGVMTEQAGMSLAEIKTKFNDLKARDDRGKDCRELVTLAALNNDPRGLVLANNIHQFCISIPE